MSMLLLLVGVNCNYEVCTVVSKQICANGCYGYEAMLIGWETTRAYWIDPLLSFELAQHFSRTLDTA